MRSLVQAGIIDPRAFGRRRPRAVAAAAPAPSTFADDVRLFAGTFAAGFLFVSILLT